jgi:prepilin-type N-terminal cleavage/methylation domain-containing protein
MNAKHSAFTLVEIMIVVAIIGLLAAIAIPSFQKARHQSFRSAYINDLRTLVSAFELYRFEHQGRYPASAGLGVQPPEIIPYMQRFDWTVTPLGGQWQWDAGSGGSNATLSISGTIWTDPDMTEIDLSIDDGNLLTGHYQKILTAFSYILE